MCGAGVGVAVAVAVVVVVVFVVVDVDDVLVVMSRGALLAKQQAGKRKQGVSKTFWKYAERIQNWLL